MREIMIQMSFSSAHWLRNYVGKCADLHGHNYRVEVYVRGQKLDKADMLADFADIKASTRRIVDYLDHKNINDLPPFDKEMNSTAERLAEYFLGEVGRDVNNDRVQVYKVRVWETDTCCASFELD
jgi:6-pyruvoyltetrahydropterin/6-carboxytetrahydropterin synthase